MSKQDYLTVFKTSAPCNKRARVNADGTVLKEAGAPIYSAMAWTVRVPDVDSMEKLQRFIAGDPCLVLVMGYVPGTEPAVGEHTGQLFYIRTAGCLAEHLGNRYTGGLVDYRGSLYAARTKDTFRPSSWWMLDRDYASGLPTALADMSLQEYCQAMNRIMPGFIQAGLVYVGSTSRRIVYNGQPLDSKGAHLWFQVQNPDDTNFGERLKQQALVNGLGFEKVTKAGARCPWAIFDPTVFSWERLIYDGKPTVADGLQVGPAEITVRQGGRVDTSLVSVLTAEQTDTLKQDYQLQAWGTTYSGTSTYDEDQLRLDTPIYTRRGLTTPREFFLSSDKRHRCQTPFRDSSSWNGILRRDKHGFPLVYDNGLRISYRLNDDQKAWLIDAKLQKRQEGT